MKMAINKKIAIYIKKTIFGTEIARSILFLKNLFVYLQY